MAGMQQVETTVGENDAAACLPWQAIAFLAGKPQNRFL
jgi:hypothetical protein